MCFQSISKINHRHGNCHVEKKCDDGKPKHTCFFIIFESKWQLLTQKYLKFWHQKKLEKFKHFFDVHQLLQ
jgi:hypothetical protein